MSGDTVGKLTRSQTGVVATDFVKSPSTGPTLEPGKKNLVQSVSLGDRYGDHGSKCDGKTGDTPGCFLSPDARQRYTGLFMRNVTVAQGNFKDACTSLQVKELLKKDDDLNWFTSLIMDFGSAFLLGAAAKVIKKLRDLGADALIEKGVMSIERGGDGAVFDRADKLLRSVTDKRIDAWTRTAFYSVKKGSQNTAKDAKNAPAHEERSDIESYLNTLKNQCDLGYNQFVSTALSEANDAEFAVLFEGMLPENHFQEIYEDALRIKLDAYKSSRVRDIGRKTTRDETGHALEQRETRVVWVKNFKSSGRRLYYQYQQAGLDSIDDRKTDPGTNWAPAWIMRMLPPEYGVLGGTNRLGGPVPDEFAEIALQRSEALYGATETIDPVKEYLASQGLEDTPASAPPADPTPGPQKQTPLPPGSVFAPDAPDGADATPFAPPASAPPPPFGQWSVKSILDRDPRKGNP